MTEEFLQTAWHLIGSFVSVSLIEEATQDFKVLFFYFLRFHILYIPV